MQRQRFFAQAVMWVRRGRAGALAHALLIVLALGPQGCASDKAYSQTELTTLQSREFDASYESTYSAAINALFDAGYTIRSSDKDAGFVAASRARGDAWAGFRFNGVQVKIDSAGPRTSVRISTTDGMGQQSVDKEQIDELLDLIQRRLIGDLSAPGAGRPAAGQPVSGRPLKGPAQ